MAIRPSAVEGLVLNPAFWQGKRVLLTGHTGFKGSWLSLWLQSLGAQVVGYALAPPTTPSLFDAADVDRGMTSLLGDIRDLAQLQAVFTDHRPEIVIHMAAQPLVRYSYQNPVETYATNVMGTVHLLEAVRNTPGVKAVVNITTDKCYENREWVWGYRENEPMGGYDPYSNSKGCAELVSASYRSSFFNASQYAQRQCSKVKTLTIELSGAHAPLFHASKRWICSCRVSRSNGLARIGALRVIGLLQSRISCG